MQCLAFVESSRVRNKMQNHAHHRLERPVRDENDGKREKKKTPNKRIYASNVITSKCKTRSGAEKKFIQFQSGGQNLILSLRNALERSSPAFNRIVLKRSAFLAIIFFA